MANEAVCIETPKRFARYTCADGTGIAIGTLLYLSGDYTVSATSGADEPFAGIAWEEKTADDGITEIVVALDGVWDILTDAGSDNVGVLVSIQGANTVGTADAADLLNGAIVGYLEEGAGNAEVCRVRLTKYGSSG
jgi:hypothetical protein